MSFMGKLMESLYKSAILQESQGENNIMTLKSIQKTETIDEKLNEDSDLNEEELTVDQIKYLEQLVFEQSCQSIDVIKSHLNKTLME